MPIAADDPEFVTSFARGLDVIRSFSREAPEMTLAEVARRTGLSRAAVRRFLLTLERLGYVGSDGKRFRLTPKVLDLGFAYLSSQDVWNIALPYLEEISAAINESCSASVLDGCDIVYVARVPTRRIMVAALHPGTRLPAFCTSMGRVLLASLEEDELRQRVEGCERRMFTPRTITAPDRLVEVIREVRRQGWALVDQELEEGLCSLAVPLRNKRGRTLAALNVSGHASRTSPSEMVDRYLPVLQHAAEQIAGALPG